MTGWVCMTPSLLFIPAICRGELMGKWVAKTAADYKNAIAKLQGKLDKYADNLSGEVISEAVNVMIDINANATDRAPNQTGYMASMSHLKVNGHYLKIPGSKTTSSVQPYDYMGAGYAHIETGWDEPIVTSKAGDSYNLALIHHEHIEFEHEAGEAKFLEKAVNDIAPTIPQRIQSAVKRAKGE